MILALDQGTTSSRALVFDGGGRVVAMKQREFAQHYPRPGWVEHDAAEIWETQLDVARRTLEESGVRAEDVAAVGITNQRETTVLWDRATGRPVAKAICWQDRRTADVCDGLRAAGHAEEITAKTGLVVDPYFCGTKIQWLLDSVPGAREKAEAGQLAFGTIDSWLLWNLSGGALHVTDVTNASRTMLWNLHTADWDDDLLRLLKVPREMLPEVRPSSAVYGETDASVLGAAVTLGGAAGDQQAALMGQSCSRRGMAKNTYGTGCFALMNIGEQPTRSTSRLLTTAACAIGDRKSYALEGSIFIGGAAVQWLRDELGVIKSASEVEPLAESVEDSGGVILVPAFAGLGAPHWDAYARGGLFGITRGTGRAHLARATLEGIAFQVADVLEAMRSDSELALDELRVDGGGSANNFLMQFQADLLGVPVVRPQGVEATAAGAAFLAGLAVGYWGSQEEIESIWQVDRVFEPVMSSDERGARRAKWADAVERCRAWEAE